ncbi:putative acetyltransferase [compost metagenome]
MPNFTIQPMTDYSKEQIEAVELLERLCKKFEQIQLRVGIEHLKKDHGDYAYLCHDKERLIGFLSWYTSDGTEANINGMVHPDYRHRGVFRNLLHRAKKDIELQGIPMLRYRVVSGSDSGKGFVLHIGASINSSEYSMSLVDSPDKNDLHPSITLHLAETKDFEFMVSCFSAAFNETNVWTRNYLTRTQEPSRTTYIAFRENVPIGLIRTNDLGNGTSVIHDFCVLPPFQGQGLGRGILVNTVKLLLANQFTHIRLGVVTDNEQALNLYLRSGFEITTEFHYYVGGI